MPTQTIPPPPPPPHPPAFYAVPPPTASRAASGAPPAAAMTISAGSPYALTRPASVTIEVRHAVFGGVAVILLAVGIVIGSAGHHRGGTPAAPTAAVPSAAATQVSKSGCGTMTTTNPMDCYNLAYSVSRSASYETLTASDAALTPDQVAGDPSVMTDLCPKEAAAFNTQMDPAEQAQYTRGCTQGTLDAIAQAVSEEGSGNADS